jgi:putative ABC transport system permease protein
MKQNLREWGLRLWGTFTRRDRQIEEELRFHLEMAEQDALRRGESPREARLRAGTLAQASESVRDQSGIPWLGDFLRDTRHGTRLLARSPLFAAAAIGSLALGIGANTAIFSLIDAVMLRMMPVHEPERLVEFAKVHEPYGRSSFSYPLFRLFHDELRSVDGLLARAFGTRREVTIGTEPEIVNTEEVSGNYYSVLGISAIAGRTFDEDIDRNPGPVAVISYAFWERRFGMDRSAIGRSFRLNRTAFRIIGVTPPEFHGVSVGEAPDMTFPLSMDCAVRGGGSWLPYDSRGWLSVMGRLRYGRSADTAQAEVSAIFSRVLQAEAGHYTKELFRKQILAQHIQLRPAGNGFDELRQRFSEPLRILMGIVALVLLIACANLANLLLGRSAARRREMAVRLAIGAGRGRVIRQMLAEGMLLATAGGVLGVLLACWSANALVTVMSNGGNRIALTIRPDLGVLGFAAAVSVAACLLFSLAPAIQAVRYGIQPALAEARGSARWRLGRGLVAAQVAISLVLLIGAGLFARTLVHLYAIETGFDRAGVLLFSVNASHAALRGPALQARVLDDLRQVPAVQSAAVARSAIGQTGWDASVRIEGYTFASNEDDHAMVNSVGPGYFRTLRTPVVLGREFDERDTATSGKVAIVNETFARRYFADRQTLGKWVYFAGQPQHPMTIVGVVKDVKSRSLRDRVPPMLYMAAMQDSSSPNNLYLVRGSMTGAMLDSVLKRIDPKLRAEDVRTLGEQLSRSILQERIMGTLTGLFGALSLVLVLVGIYGVMAFQVARRQKEIGIRLALGARPAQVTRMVLMETALPVGAGVAAGIAGALALTRVLQKMLFGVKPTDLVTFAGACGLLVALALIAAYLPGRVAARLNPVETLRCE